MHLLTQFNAFIEQENLFQRKDKLLIAVSGGVDSIVLCDLCAKAGYDFTIAHCNFKLRGVESDEDEKFVKSLGLKYGVEVKSISFDTQDYAEANLCNIQIAARALRYNWFNELLNQLSINYILTAHHANDNIETLLMNFFKGTGINGLQGIAAKDAGIGGKVARPLLFATKEEILEYAQVNQLTWREDQSNQTNKYTRNYFRNELLPSIEKVFPKVNDNLMDNLNRFKEVNTIYDLGLSTLLKKLMEPKGEDIYISVLKLLKTPALSTVLFEILSKYQFTSHQIPEAIKLLKADTGKYLVSPTHRLLKNRQWMILSPIKSLQSGCILIEAGQTDIEFLGGELKIKTIETPLQINKDNKVALLDSKEIKFPLLLRKYKQGDYFYPLGMSKKKKLSRFFIDSKLSLKEKEQIWVIESNKKIIWVLGYRIDDRFKITPQTKEVLSINLIPTK